MRPRSSRQIQRFRRNGQALIEFALVALVLYLLIGGAITFGLWTYAAGQIQQAANLGARELSQTPLAFDQTFEEALESPVVRSRIYDDRWLVIDLDQLEQENANYNFFTDVVPQMPALNQQLAPLYIVDSFDNDGDPATPPIQLMRYPGALLSRTEPVTDPPIDDSWVAQQYVVQIPLVVERQVGHNNGGGAERIRWVDVVEEIDDDIENIDPFSLENPNEDLRGVVAMRVHFPAQSTWLSSFQVRGEFAPNGGDPNAADDGSVEILNPEAMRGSLISSQSLLRENDFGEQIYAGTNGGSFGLGVHGAMTSPELTGSAIGIRPYRRVLVSQAIFRRELFLPASP